MLAIAVRPGKHPSMAGLVAGRSIESAHLMRVEIIVANRELLTRPLEARECKTGMKSHVKTAGLQRVGADRGIAVQILRDDRPVLDRFDSSAQAGKARPPCIATGVGLLARVAVIVVAQRANLEPIVMLPAQSAIEPWLAVYLVIEVKRRSAQAAEQLGRTIAQPETAFGEQRSGGIVPPVCRRDQRNFAEIATARAQPACL